ncbi:MAG: GntR family transcriptional regulator [Chloroflexi bacterium]|nr:MAG: GntR family transcriptional regulator [Chloroflexota bacterium]
MLPRPRRRGSRADGVAAMPRIERGSRVPYYRQLLQILHRGIEEGRWKAGELIPSESALVATYGISRTVIRQALDLLSIQGQVRRVKGKGTFVVEGSMWDVSPELSGRYEKLSASYRVHSILDNRITEPDPDRRKALALGQSATVLHVVVTSSRADQPDEVATFSTFDVVSKATPALEELIRSGRTPRFQVGGPAVPVQLAERVGLRLSHSRTTLSSINCSAAEAKIVGTEPGTSVLCFEWVTYDVAGRPVIAGRSITKEGARLYFAVPHRAH